LKQFNLKKNIFIFLITISSLHAEDYFDINFNVVSLFTFEHFFSTEVSYVVDKHNIEIGIPIVYENFIHKRYENSQYNYEQTHLNVDLHINYFFTNSFKNRVFFGIFSRYTYTKGKLENDFRLLKEDKFGMGVQIGIKKMLDESFYLKFSLSLGRYFGANAKFNDNSNLLVSNEKIFFDFELLKLGIIF